MTFLEKQTDPESPMHWRGNMQADYLYTNGTAGDRFFKHMMKKDSFLASKCQECGTIYFPPRLYCEDCFVEIPAGEWFEVPAKGRIRLSTTARLNTFGEKLKEPVILALIDVDGTHGAMVGVLKTKKMGADLCGAHVKAVFRPKKEREGTLKDILHFVIE